MIGADRLQTFLQRHADGGVGGIQQAGKALQGIGNRAARPGEERPEDGAETKDREGIGGEGNRAVSIGIALDPARLLAAYKVHHFQRLCALRHIQQRNRHVYRRFRLDLDAVV